ncbi:hypothetical protein NPIL_634931, partial [Nephila pilipes]
MEWMDEQVLRSKGLDHQTAEAELAAEVLPVHPNRMNWKDFLNLVAPTRLLVSINIGCNVNPVPLHRIQ